MLWRGAHGELLVGRREEVGALRRMAAEAAAGRGNAVLVEGEPGIGKSTVIAAGLAGAAELGCRVLWGTADELSSRFPLRVLLDTLTQQEKAEVTVADPVDRLLALLGKSVPLVLVVDDLQWVDDPTLRVLRLARGLPLLLVGAARPAPRNPELARLRDELPAIVLGPLPGEQVDELADELFGAAGPEWRELAAQTGGNPLYLKELADSAARDAEYARLPGQLPRLPASLGAVIDARLATLSRDTAWAIRTAALLGAEFTVGELAAVLDRKVDELSDVVAEARAAAVLVDAGERLAWRQPLVRQALYEAMPWGMRAALHRHVAQRLSSAPDRTTREALDPWLFRWTTVAGSALARCSPAVAAGLLRQAAGQLPGADPRRADLEVRVAGLLRILGPDAELARHARAALARTSDPAHVARMTGALASALLDAGRAEDAAAELDRVLAGLPVEQPLVSRLRSLRALASHDGGPLAAQALEEAERSGDPFALALARYALSRQASVDGDPAASLRHLDLALALPAVEPEHVDLGFLLRGKRILLLTEVERLSRVVPQARELLVLAELAGTGRIADIQAVAAVVCFHAGDWDAAIAHLGTASHGVRALIAGYRDDDATPADAQDEPYAVLARALADVRAHRPEAALAALTAALARPVGRPDLLAPAAVRIALRLGRDPTEVPGAQLCRGLIEADPEPVSRAAEYFRKADRPLDSAEAFEDLAVVRARRGERAAAVGALAEALAGYGALGATWPVRQAAERLSEYGITM